jgi:hypothetical protein
MHETQPREHRHLTARQAVRTMRERFSEFDNAAKEVDRPGSEDWGWDDGSIGVPDLLAILDHPRHFDSQLEDVAAYLEENRDLYDHLIHEGTDSNFIQRDDLDAFLDQH